MVVTDRLIEQVNHSQRGMLRDVPPSDVQLMLDNLGIKLKVGHPALGGAETNMILFALILNLLDRIETLEMERGRDA